MQGGNLQSSYMGSRILTWVVFKPAFKSSSRLSLLFPHLKHLRPLGKDRQGSPVEKCRFSEYETCTARYSLTTQTAPHGATLYRPDAGEDRACTDCPDRTVNPRPSALHVSQPRERGVGGRQDPLLTSPSFTMTYPGCRGPRVPRCQCSEASLSGDPGHSMLTYKHLPYKLKHVNLEVKV